MHVFKKHTTTTKHTQRNDTMTSTTNNTTTERQRYIDTAIDRAIQCANITSAVQFIYHSAAKLMKCHVQESWGDISAQLLMDFENEWHAMTREQRDEHARALFDELLETTPEPLKPDHSVSWTHISTGFCDADNAAHWIPVGTRALVLHRQSGPAYGDAIVAFEMTHDEAAQALGFSIEETIEILENHKGWIVCEANTGSEIVELCADAEAMCISQEFGLVDENGELLESDIIGVKAAGEALMDWEGEGEPFIKPIHGCYSR